MAKTLVALNERSNGTEGSYNALRLSLGELTTWIREADKILFF